MKSIEPVYNYSNFQDYLSAATKHLLNRSQRPYSLAQWAKKLGYNSPRTVGMVLKGQRIPSADMARAWSQALGHDFKQRRYFELLVQMARENRRNKSVADILRELESLAPGKSTKVVIDLKEFSFVADWYHVVLKQIVSIKNEKTDLDSLFMKLQKKVSRAQIKKALENLIALGLIEAGKSPDTYVIKKESFTTTNDIPSEAIRLHHRQMMQRAQESLEEQHVNVREITSSTLRFDLDRMREAKQVLREFKEEFEKKFVSTKSKEVYQFNIQFFTHTSLKEKGAENE